MKFMAGILGAGEGINPAGARSIPAGAILPGLPLTLRTPYQPRSPNRALTLSAKNRKPAPCESVIDHQGRVKIFNWYRTLTLTGEKTSSKRPRRSAPSRYQFL
jgi:hypothetical protein